ELAAELRHGDIPVIAQQLRELKAEEKEVAAALGEAQQQAAQPLSETWHALATLSDAISDLDSRRRLRSAISRIVETIRLLVIPRGRDRLAAVQVVFAGGERFRSYIILHRPPLWIGTSLRPGNWWARSLAEIAPGELDLRRREDARLLKE